MDFTVIELPQELLAPASYAHYEGEYTLPRLTAGPDTYAFAEPLHWSAEVSNTGDAILLQGEVEGCGTTACARCLEPTDVDLFGELEGYYLLDGSDAPADMEADEFDVLPADHKIDLAPLIEAALLLDVPYVPLCAEDCRGLCPTCGANLNDGDCGCAAAAAKEAQANSPFAALAALRLDEGETPRQ